MEYRVLIKKMDITFYKKFKRLWKHYLIQIPIATLSIFIATLFINIQNTVMIASIGATTFIIFILPTSYTANRRNVIGGHLIGIGVGMLFTLIPASSSIILLLIFSLTVGTAMLFMAIFDMEHPPACGTALGVVSFGYTFPSLFAFITGIIVLSLLHHFFKSKLKDLI
ncbi:MAG: HPP family protein [Candidatus Marinimicrobia bacterium]|nr:HPP family protein [Candidatus Neomarinimicrobiota bacterium]